MIPTTKNNRRVPEVDQFVEAIRTAQNLSEKLGELPSLKEEISRIETDIREAESDAKAMVLATDLAGKKAKATVLELRSHHHREAAEQAWYQACRLGVKAAHTMSEITSKISGRATESIQNLLCHLVDPQIDAAITGGDGHTAQGCQQRKSSGVMGMAGIARVVWSIRVGFSIHTQLPAPQFTARLLEEIEEVERDIPLAEVELQRLEKATVAIEGIFA